ncbi:LOW QUALITY PROTEIN: two-component system response regulator, partial [Streptomyces sp. SPB78]
SCAGRRASRSRGRPRTARRPSRGPAPCGPTSCSWTCGCRASTGSPPTRAIVAEGLADVLVLTTFGLDAYVFGALRAGAAGFLLKTAEAGELVAAVRTVAAGDGVVDPAVTRRLLAEFARGGTGRERPAPEGLARLTPREREVLSCLGEGLGNAEIAERIDVAEGTVKSHVRRLLAKLGLRNRLQASLLARDLGL